MLIKNDDETIFISDHAAAMQGALGRQVAGSHYKTLPMQPVEFCQKNKLGFCESSAIKYLCRHKEKGGVQDLKKALHFIELLIQLEYGDEKS